MIWMNVRHRYVVSVRRLWRTRNISFQYSLLIKKRLYICGMDDLVKNIKTSSPTDKVIFKNASGKTTAKCIHPGGILHTRLRNYDFTSDHPKNREVPSKSSNINPAISLKKSVGNVSKDTPRPQIGNCRSETQTGSTSICYHEQCG